MRFALASLIVAFSAVSVHACWGVSYWYPEPVYYVPVYWVPVYYPPACTCPTLPPPKVESTPTEKPQPPKASRAETPYSPIVPATSSVPAEEKPENKLPVIELPMKTEPPKPELPKVEAPKLELPKIESSKPMAPAIELQSLAPPSTPKLELPPLPPIEVKKVTANYRPATSSVIVPVEGTTPANGKYHIGFFNFSERDLTVTVNGDTIQLPKRSSVTATVERSFRFAVDGRESETAIVPATAVGFEVILK